MGRSFVLKDASGQMRGYIMQGMRDIRCRLSHAEGKMAAVLIFEDGLPQKHEVNGHEEACWRHDGGVLLGGYVCKDGRLLCATDERVRKAYWQAEMREWREKNAEAAGAEQPENTQESSAREDSSRKKENVREDEAQRVDRGINRKADQETEDRNTRGKEKNIRDKEDQDEIDETEQEKKKRDQKDQKGRNEKTGKQAGMCLQRRWPPPPCWPQAQYRNGRWQEP